ncbi:uncharacterized protein TRIREDRAFT_109253 [Trichoderma reesei QM6a]|jgi:hypothetical protein|uniref:Predicted protein n=2 Tax=Hypocrea jecorina TaxID=51453 RepID=G0RP63_HYPJQ|nr:uncharacterized protein TRIREDRAFT_109253 [Trichoderma reesei QM6a]EGR47056.1 predicted protein [Trichoderma reesei QM6a]ETR99803.1 hypothetical protein M419DRAFT_10736 [Trichoderma reesei RUT C-30]
MQFSTTSLLAVLTAASFTAAEQMKINYYSNNACSAYTGQVDVTWATELYGGGNNCYNYHFSNYANIANCYEDSCLCDFYSGQNCAGSSVGQATGSGNCVYVQNAQSFACYYT